MMAKPMKTLHLHYPMIPVLIIIIIILANVPTVSYCTDLSTMKKLNWVQLFYDGISMPFLLFLAFLPIG